MSTFVIKAKTSTTKANTVTLNFFFEDEYWYLTVFKHLKSDIAQTYHHKAPDLYTLLDEFANNHPKILMDQRQVADLLAFKTEMIVENLPDFKTQAEIDEFNHG